MNEREIRLDRIRKDLEPFYMEYQEKNIPNLGVCLQK